MLATHNSEHPDIVTSTDKRMKRNIRTHNWHKTSLNMQTTTKKFNISLLLHKERYKDQHTLSRSDKGMSRTKKIIKHNAETIM